RRSSFSLVFIAAPLKASDDLPDLLSSFPYIPGNVEFGVRRKHSRICVRIQCVERRPVTHDQSLYVQLVLNPLLRVVWGRTCLHSSDYCNHVHDQGQSDCPKSPHSPSRRMSSHSGIGVSSGADLIYLGALAK